METQLVIEWVSQKGKREELVAPNVQLGRTSGLRRVLGVPILLTVVAEKGLCKS